MEEKQKVKANGKVLAWFFGILTVIILLLVKVALSDDKRTNTTYNRNATAVEQKKSDFELLSSNFRKDGNIKYVVGRIKNTSGKNLSYVQVSINLYDRNGNQIGSTLDNVNNLANNSIWSFKAIVLDEKAYKYEIVEVFGR